MPITLIWWCSQALQEMGCELRVFEASNKIKACLMTAKGMIGVVLQVYSSDGAGSPSMVEVSHEYACFFLCGPIFRCPFDVAHM